MSAPNSAPRSAWPIAIVGMAGRFPGAADVDALWRLLNTETDAVTSVPASRWDARMPLDARVCVAPVGGFLDDVDLFDAAFFGISPGEACELDPQQRLLLEICQRTLEDAGIASAALAGSRTGVYVAASSHDHARLRAQQRAPASAYAATGSALDMLSARIAQQHRLHGPALTVSAGGASSLVALDLACRAIAAGEIEGALVAAVNLLLAPGASIDLAHLGLLSPSGRCRAFAATADGYVRGEGAIALYLQPLARARAAGNHVHALISASAVAHDGGPLPLARAQEALLCRAHAFASAQGVELAYVEAHGEGCPRADRAEAEALGRALARTRARPLPIGSIKTNLGHLEAAAGLAGVVKGVLALTHRRVPASLHAAQLSPEIAFEALNLELVRAPLALAATTDLQLGVSARAHSGTCAHVILQSAPPAPRPKHAATHARDDGSADARTPYLVAISARDESALGELALALAEAVTERDLPLPLLAGTLAHRRDHFAQRAAFVVSDTRELTAQLVDFARGAADRTIAGRARTPVRIALVIAGESGAWAALGARLACASATFADVLHRCAAALTPHVGWDLAAAITGARADDVHPGELEVASTWAVALGLAALWREAGILPDVVMGHGLGEVAAACIAGVLDHDDAGRVVAQHARGANRQQAIASIADALAELAPRAGTATFVSGVEGRARAGLTLDAAYWARVTTAPTRLGEALVAACDSGVTHVIELSPQRGLGLDIAALMARRAETPRVLAGMHAGAAAQHALTTAFAHAYVAGLAPFAQLPREGLAKLPGQPLRPRHFGIGQWSARADSPRVRGARFDAVGLEIALAPSAIEPGCWEGTRTLDPASLPWLAEHHVHARAVLPAAALLGCALLAARSRREPAEALVDLRFAAPLPLSDGPRVLSLVVRNELPHGASLRLSSREADASHYVEHARARLARVQPAPAHGLAHFDSASLARAGARFDSSRAPALPSALCASEPRDVAAFYARCERLGLDLGPALRVIARLQVSGEQALAELVLPSACHATLRPDALHDALLVGALQLALATCDEEVALVPLAIARARTLLELRTPVLRAWAFAERRGARMFDLTVYDAARVPLLQLDGLTLTPAPRAPRAPEHVLRLRFRQATASARHAESESWLVCGARDDGAEQVAAALRALGNDVTRAAALAPSVGAWSERLQAAGDGPAGIAFLAPREACDEVQRAALAALTALVAACAALTGPPRLAIVTTHAQAIHESDPVYPDGGLYWGFARVLRREHGALAVRVIDRGTDAASITACAIELVARDHEDQVALRGDRRFVARLTRGTRADEPARTTPWQLPAQPLYLTTSHPGSWQALAFRPLARRAPGPGEVEIAITAAALSPADLVTARDDDGPSTSPGAPPVFGSACAGRVVAVGPGIGAVRVGDRVVAATEGAVASHVTVAMHHVQKTPPALSDAQAAALPCALTTAWHALRNLARLDHGEHVLIAAPSGLGLAAITVARQLGAQVSALAESEAQRARLHAIGVAHVFDARTLGWRDELRAVTAGRGVDVVVSTQRGAALRAGLELLAEDGRFIAVGPRDLDEGRSLGLDVFAKGIAFAALDLVGMRARRPLRFARLLAEVWAEVMSGRLASLPMRTMRFSEAGEALRALARAEHPDALVLVDPDGVRSVVPTALTAGRFRADATYVVTGGLGTVGLALVAFMAERGARAFLLLARSPASASAAARIAALRQAGIRVEVQQVDVADRVALAHALDAARAHMPPLRGVVHAASIRDDAPILELTPALLARALAPKVEGARNLDALTTDDPLDLFVLCSSAAALCGSSGHVVHAVGDGYLDALAEARRRRGQPALSIQLGPLAAVGRDATRASQREDTGLGSILAEEAFTALLAFLEADETVVAYVPLTVARWLDAHPDAATQKSWQALREHAEVTAQR